MLDDDVWFVGRCVMLLALVWERFGAQEVMVWCGQKIGG